VVSDLFLSVGHLSFGEKTGKNGKRMEKKEEKGERDSSTHLPAHRLKTSSLSLSLSPFSSFFSPSFLFFLQS